MSLRPWNKGDPFEAAHLQEPVTEISNGLPITGGPGIVVRRIVGGGTTVSLDASRLSKFAPVLGRVITTGPVGDEPDYSDYRYWIRLQVNEITSANKLNDDELSIEDVPDDAPDEWRVVTAYNLGEYAASTHTLAEDAQVTLILLSVDSPQEDGVVPQGRWFIVGGPSGGLPTPQYQYMVMQAVAQNQLGADWVRGHDLT